MQIRLKRLDDGVEIPKRAHPGDAGVDLVTVVDVDLAPGERKLVGTGIAIELPLGMVGLVTPRSGLAARCGLTIVNAPGVVDAGYRGEIKVCLLNTDREHPISLVRGDRIAQLLVQRVELVDFVEANELSTSERGEGGHGSSGGAGALDAQTLATRYGEQ